MNTASRRSRLPHLSAPSVQPHRHPSIVLRRPALHRIRGMNNVGRIPRAFEWLMAALAILVIPALVLERRAPTPEIRTAALVLNWVIWLAFVIEFVVRWIADGRRSFPRRAWFDVVLIAVTPPIGVPDSMQGFRALRALRVLRLFRAFGVIAMALRLAKRHFGSRRFHYVGLVAIATVLLGAAGVYVVEGDENRAISSYGDALWWAVVTATTVGYGDVSPVTAEGRVIAVVLMLTGIGVIGVFTATVASFFFEHEQQCDSAELAARLDRIEQKLDELLRK
jgi:voltage-gated potassium channel